MRVFLFLFALLLPVTAEAKPLVVASFSILGNMAQQVGGDDIEVKTLVGAGGDAHVYEPTPADARAIKEANLLIVNGLGFEGWMARLTQSSGYHGSVVTATDGVTPLLNGNAPDPHAWQDISDAEIYVKNICNALVKTDPIHADTYRTNAARYLAELAALDASVQEQMNNVPQEKRRAIISHDAFGYFAARYHVTFLAPLGISTAAEPGARDMARLVDQIRTSHVHAVFLENMSDPRLMQQLARDGGATIGGTLYSDALSPASGDAPTYTALMRHNAAALAEAMLRN